MRLHFTANLKGTRSVCDCLLTSDGTGGNGAASLTSDVIAVVSSTGDLKLTHPRGGSSSFTRLEQGSNSRNDAPFLLGLGAQSVLHQRPGRPGCCRAKATSFRRASYACVAGTLLFLRFARRRRKRSVLPRTIFFSGFISSLRTGQAPAIPRVGSSTFSSLLLGPPPAPAGQSCPPQRGSWVSELEAASETETFFGLHGHRGDDPSGHRLRCPIAKADRSRLHAPPKKRKGQAPLNVYAKSGA